MSESESRDLQMLCDILITSCLLAACELKIGRPSKALELLEEAISEYKERRPKPDPPITPG